MVVMKGFNPAGFLHVHKMLKKLILTAVEEHHQSLHRAVAAAVKWQFEQGDKWRDFEPILNSELEREYKKKSKTYDITDARNRKYRIDFAANKEYRVDENNRTQGEGIKIRRFDRTRGGGEPLPKRWEQMRKEENLKLVEVKNGSEEFNGVQTLFNQHGANFPIKKLQRIQNKSLYQQYKVKKREMDNLNPKGHQNEKRLFHGTAATSIPAITENGFNRSYCGKNGTAMGKGVYFATQSSYSAGYAQADAQGNHHMFLARVLTGESCPSSSSHNYLPNKPGTNRPYDSGIGGSNYVIFYDTQAYPEYLIIF